EGASFVAPLGVVLDETVASRAYVVDAFARAVIAVDLDTGDREILSRVDSNPADGDDSVGGGEAFVTPEDVVHDAGNARLLVADSRKVLAVDLASGDRTLFAAVDASVRSMVLDVAGNRLLFGDDNFSGSIHALDLASKERTLLSGSTHGAGPALLSVRSVAPPGAD